jgi:hypothetical protein
MHGGSQPTDISLIHRRSSRLVPHHPVLLSQNIKPVPPLTGATISVSGDIVLISCFDKRRQKFVTLSLSGASGVIGATSDFDYMFKPPVWSEYFSIKHC